MFSSPIPHLGLLALLFGLEKKEYIFGLNYQNETFNQSRMLHSFMVRFFCVMQLGCFSILKLAQGCGVPACQWGWHSSPPLGWGQAGSSSTSPRTGSAASGFSSSGHLSIVTQALKPDKTSINIPGKNTGAAALGFDGVFQLFGCISFSALKKSPDINENLSINPN